MMPISVLMQVIEAQEDMPIAGVVTLYSSLLTFTLHVHPDRLDYVDQILVGQLLFSPFFFYLRLIQFNHVKGKEEKSKNNHKVD